MKRLVESPENDQRMHEVADAAALLVGKALWHDQEPDYWGDFHGLDENLTEAFCYTPGSLDFKPEWGMRNVAVLIGPRRSPSITATTITYDAPVFRRFNIFVVVWALRKMDRAEYRSIVGTRLHEVLLHEFIHVQDVLRSKKVKGVGSYIDDDGEIDREEYYNNALEFNAYYHNLVSRYHGFLKHIKADPDNIADYADIFGIKRDFKEMVADIRNHTGLRQFLKWLNDGRRKALLKRLYKLHNLVIAHLDRQTAH